MKRANVWRGMIVIACLGMTGGSLWDGSGVRAEEPVAEVTRKLEDLPLSVYAIIENGRKLRSGSFRATGVYMEQVLDEKGRIFRKERDRYDFCVEEDFDYEADRFFFRAEKSRRGGKPVPNGFADSSTWYLNSSGVISTIQGNENHRTARIYGRDGKEALRGLEHTLPIFDPRMLGWGGISRASKLEEFLELGLLKHELTVTEERPGIERVRRRAEADKDLYTISDFWCSKSQGGQPIRELSVWDDQREKEVQLRKRLEAEGPPPLCKKEIDWEEKAGVWVVKFVAVDEYGDSLRMTVHWDNVNEAIPSERFDWKRWVADRDYEIFQDLRGAREKAEDPFP